MKSMSKKFENRSVYCDSVPGPGSGSEEGSVWRAGGPPVGAADASSAVRGISPAAGHGGEWLVFVCVYIFFLPVISQGLRIACVVCAGYRNR